MDINFTAGNNIDNYSYFLNYWNVQKMKGGVRENDERK